MHDPVLLVLAVVLVVVVVLNNVRAVRRRRRVGMPVSRGTIFVGSVGLLIAAVLVVAAFR